MKSQKVQQNYTYQFPAIRGVQAGREYYSFMCPLEYLISIFAKSDEELPPEMSSQRMLNKGRIPAMTRYVVENRHDYVFSSLTASVSGNVEFLPISETPPIDTKIGSLTVPMNATFVVNDGQHRLAALKKALRESPDLKYETISIVLFIDQGLTKSQQMFADLNRYAVKPTKSLSILYDHRDPLAKLSYDQTKKISYFKGMVEMEKPSISNRSKKLFTLSSIYQANGKLLNKKEGDEISPQEIKLCSDFWEELGKCIPDWINASQNKICSYELRRDYIHAHGVAMQALANLGESLISRNAKWKAKLKGLKGIDWRRNNANLWEGRATIGGTINRSQSNVILTGNVLKKHLGLSLNPSEVKVENEYSKGQA